VRIVPELMNARDARAFDLPIWQTLPRSNAGYQMGGWHDVGWWELRLQPLVAEPAEPTLLPALVDGAA